MENEIKIGQAVTVVGWTDRYAYHVIYISKGGNKLILRRAKVTRLDKNGMSECQDWDIQPGDEGMEELSARLTKKGWKAANGNRVNLSGAREYYDYSF